jgi:predicted XRE-type DNA-binding protein
MEKNTSLFSSIYDDESDAAVAQMKSKLRAILVLSMERKNISQTEAAKLFHCAPIKVNCLKKGVLNNISVDFLIKSLIAIGHDVEFKYDPNNIKKPFSMKLTCK